MSSSTRHIRPVPDETTATATAEGRVRHFLSAPRTMLIGGVWEPAVSGRVFDTVDPATGSVLTQVPDGDHQDIDRAVGAARRAFANPDWRRRAPSTAACCCTASPT